MGVGSGGEWVGVDFFFEVTNLSLILIFSLSGVDKKVKKTSAKGVTDPDKK